MLEDVQVAPSGKSVLEDLAEKGFTKHSEQGENKQFHIYSDGKKNIWYDTKTESIVCTTVAYSKDKPLE
jgi:predicted transcriptional regulator